MGWNIARAAAEAGWETSLVLGPSQLGDPDGVRVSRVVSALDMLEECERLFDACDMLIMSAAVSDVRPAERLARKASKSRIDLNPRLERTPDILKTLSQKRAAGFLWGSRRRPTTWPNTRGKSLKRKISTVLRQTASLRRNTALRPTK